MTGPTPGRIEVEIERPLHGPHHETIVVDGRPVDTLRDLPPARGGLLFVISGIAPASVAAGHYGQDPAGRRAWERLVRAGILPDGTDLSTADDALVAGGHGIAAMEKGPAGAVDRPAAGVGALWQKVAIWRPAAIVFVDRDAAEAAAGRPLAEPWGVLPSVALAGRPCILMPPDDGTREQVDEGVNLLRNLLAALPARPGA